MVETPVRIPCPILQHLGSVPGSGPDPNSLKGSSDGASNWVPAMHVGDLDAVPSAQFRPSQPSPDHCRQWLSEPVVDSLLLFLCLSNTNMHTSIRTRFKEKEVYLGAKVLRSLCSFPTVHISHELCEVS